MKMLRGLGLVLSVGLVVAVTAWETQQSAGPGPLHPAHASVIELQGARGCDKCHGSDGWQAGTLTVAAACSKCHAAIAAQVREHRGLHGALEPKLASDCGGCHVDHHGDRAPLVTSASFELAGIQNRADYRHQHVPHYALTGQHRDLRCADCHLHADEVEVPRGQGRFLGQQSACAACHEDPHRGGFGRDCEQCHGQQQGFRAAPGFDHRRFRLSGAHHQVGCEKCHPPGSERDVRQAQQQPPPVRACAECHQSPHAASFLASVAADAGGPAGACGRCHDPARHRFFPATMTAAQHEATGFPLTRPHAGIACETCHGPSGRGFEQRFQGERHGDCRNCHVDHHRGQFDLERYPKCTACHAQTHFKPAPFDQRTHDKTRFPLIGQHATVACVNCHPTVVDGVRQYAGTSSSCAACHQDVHGGLFDRAHVQAPVGGQADCGRCHSPHGFAVRRPRFEHVWTGFPLTGAHAAVDCAGCHPRTATADRQGRHFQRAAGRDCAICHTDPHAGQFVQAGAVDCTRCHQTTSFAASLFDHQRQSRFKLDATHKQVACAQCHPTVTNQRGAFVRYKPLGTECKDCHQLDEDGEVRRAKRR